MRTTPLYAAVGVVAFLASDAVSLDGQDGTPRFEVASIKPRVGDAFQVSGPGIRPGGVLTGSNVTLASLIMFAYGIQDFQIAGGPDWLRSTRYDVSTRALGEPAPERTRLMLRTLLAERFGLRARTEPRELPVYEIHLARSDRRLGPNLHDCAELRDMGGRSSPEKPFRAPTGALSRPATAPPW